MALLSKLRRGSSAAPSPRALRGEAQRHLDEFLRAHGSAEAYLEPQTTVTEPTLLLVAPSGEWTRRRMPTDDARRFARAAGIAVFDATVTGYPQRMRDWTARRAAEQRDAERKRP